MRQPAEYRQTDVEVERRPGAQSRWNPGKDLGWEPLRIERVCEVRYDQLHEGRFRHVPTFLRWRALPAPQRGEYVRQIGNAFREHKELLGKLVTLEAGKIVQEGLGEARLITEDPLAPPPRCGDYLGYRFALVGGPDRGCEELGHGQGAETVVQLEPPVDRADAAADGARERDPHTGRGPIAAPPPAGGPARNPLPAGVTSRARRRSRLAERTAHWLKT